MASVLRISPPRLVYLMKLITITGVELRGFEPLTPCLPSKYTRWRDMGISLYDEVRWVAGGCMRALTDAPRCPVVPTDPQTDHVDRHRRSDRGGGVASRKKVNRAQPIMASAYRVADSAAAIATAAALNSRACASRLRCGGARGCRALACRT